MYSILIKVIRNRSNSPVKSKHLIFSSRRWNSTFVWTNRAFYKRWLFNFADRYNIWHYKSSPTFTLHHSCVCYQIRVENTKSLSFLPRLNLVYAQQIGRRKSRGLWKRDRYLYIINCQLCHIAIVTMLSELYKVDMWDGRPTGLMNFPNEES